MLKATLIGNLGSDPEMRYSANGQPFLRFNVASNYRTRTPEGEWQDKTEWVRVTIFGQRAETYAQSLRKGSRVYVDGRLEARPWTDQQGQVRAGLELVVSDIMNITSRDGDERMSGDGGDRDFSGGRPASGASSAPPRSAPPRSRPEPEEEGDLEDLPF